MAMQPAARRRTTFMPLLLTIICSFHSAPATVQSLFGRSSHSSTRGFKSGILREEQLGIHRFMLVGQMMPITGVPMTMKVIGFLKFRPAAAPGMCTVRGMLIPHMPVVNQERSEVELDLEWRLRLQLRSYGAPDIQLELHTTDIPKLPYGIHEQDIPCVGNNSQPITYTVHIDSWHTYADVVPALTMMFDEAAQLFSTGFWVAWSFSNFPGQNIAPAHAYNMFNHMQYHFKLGVRGYLVYIDSALLGPLMETDPRVKKLMAAGKLRFILMQGLPLYPGWPHAWQQVSFSYIALAAWGADVYLSFLDRDEVLGLKVGGSLRQLIQECGHGKAALKLAMTLRHCSSCTVDHVAGDLSTFQKVMPRAGVVDNFYKLYKDKCEARHYNIKLIIHPRGILRVAVHTVTMQRGHEQVFVDRSCATYVHLHNLFRTRFNATESEQWNCTMEHDELWTWPLKGR